MSQPAAVASASLARSSPRCQPWSSRPRLPSGSSRLWSGPATKPSSEIDMWQVVSGIGVLPGWLRFASATDPSPGDAEPEPSGDRTMRSVPASSSAAARSPRSSWPGRYYAPPMKGVVAAGSQLTAEAGAWALREGGNAFDAAVCCVLASFTSESLLTGMGAGGFLLAHTSDNEDHLLDFFVEAGGRGLDPEARADLVAAEVRFDETPQIFNVGAASCGVPGTPAGIWEMSERFCSMPL